MPSHRLLCKDPTISKQPGQATYTSCMCLTAYPTTLPSWQSYSAIGNQLFVYSLLVPEDFPGWFGTRWYFLFSRLLHHQLAAENSWNGLRNFDPQPLSDWLKTIYLINLPYLDGLVLSITNFLGLATPHSGAVPTYLQTIMIASSRNPHVPC